MPDHYRDTESFHDTAALERDGYYDASLHRTSGHLIWTRMIWRLTAGMLDNPPTILDAGCGRGDFTQQLAARFGAKVTGCDISVSMLEIARARAPELRFERADFRSLPFADREFDSTTCVYAFQHILPIDRDQVLAEFCRVTSRRVVMEFTNRESFYYLRKPELHFSGLTTYTIHLKELEATMRQGGFALRVEIAWSACLPGYDKTKVLQRVHDYVIRHAIEDGAQFVSFGATFPGDEGLLFYKAGYGCEHRNIYSYYWNMTPPEISPTSFPAVRSMLRHAPVWAIKAIAPIATPLLA